MQLVIDDPDISYSNHIEFLAYSQVISIDNSFKSDVA